MEEYDARWFGRKKKMENGTMKDTTLGKIKKCSMHNAMPFRKQ
jgi:hypothetical protein